jgi:predicted nuclease of predicted toxin-antitoxin system
MRFKLDENLPVEGTAVLRAAGHDASSVTDQGLEGSDDRALDQVCREEGRILVTLDLDFADIRGYPPAESPGRIVLRLSTQERRHILAMLQKTCAALQAESPAARLWIVEDERIRVRE